MRKEKKVLLILLLLVVGLITIFMSYILIINNCKVEEIRKLEGTNIELSLNKGIKVTNLNDVYNSISDYHNCGIIIKELTNSIKYFNIILEDVPKADTVNQYYRVNNYTISELYALTSEEEFNTFYTKIAPLQELRGFEILTNTIQNTAYEYSLEVKLIGNKEMIIPVIISINDVEKMESTSYWNKE
uniref:hypothetical protein n=1 Tax=Clostridium botulinum TaxID=1491 RepID=UPI00155DC6E0|nr:hypothetical protein [Clostridium botulinum]